MTIYTFIPQELRVNYPVETPNLTDYARVNSIAMTQNESTDYEKIRKRIASSGASKRGNAKMNFEFALPGGRIITSMSQLSNPQSVNALNEYLSEKENYDKLREELASLRQAYANRDKSVTDRILSAEQELADKKLELLRLKNRVVRLESR